MKFPRAETRRSKTKHFMSKSTFVCGSEESTRTSDQAQKVQMAMQKIVSLIRSQGNLSEVFTAIAAADLPGARSAEGYWVINEGRYYSKRCSGMAVPGTLIEDDAALESCLKMGEGIKLGRKGLQVHSVADLKRLARFIEDVCKKTGYSVSCTPLQATAAMCEATRRGCFRKEKGVKHRRGR